MTTQNNTAKTVCYFGIFKPEFIRNAVLIEGFKQNGYEVVLCRVDPAVGGMRKFVELYKKGKQIKKEHDISHVVVGFPGNPVVWLARLLFGKRVIFDAFLSQYDANVFDRKLYGRFHPRAWRDWFYDWYACTLAWKVLLPERVHIQYFLDTFPVSEKKFIRVFTGANNTVFHPMPDVKKDETFTIHFHGNFIPLQGIPYIVKAAEILKEENIVFRIVGGSAGALFEKIQQTVADNNLTNVLLVGRKPLEEVPVYIARAHISLGVFGDTEKTKRVISNKIYEELACAAPVVTSRTPATEELLTDKKNVLFVRPADGADLAEKIMMLKSDEALREKIARGGYKLFEERLTPQKLVAGLLEELR